MTQRHSWFLGLILSMLAVAPWASASPILSNGDFSEGLDSWEISSGTGEEKAQEDGALLSTGQGADFFSISLVQGDNGLFLFDNPVPLPEETLSLNFDARLYSRSVDSSETGAARFDDSFSVSVYDSVDSLRDERFLDIPLAESVEHHSYDISALAGRNVAFSFDLIDEDDGFNTSVWLDNVFVELDQTDVTVDEPSSIALLICALLALALRFRSPSASKL